MTIDPTEARRQIKAFIERSGRGGAPSVHTRNRSEAATFVLSRLQDLGIKVNPTSRLARMEKVYRENHFVNFDDPAYETAREAIRDVTILEGVLSLPDCLFEDDQVVSRLRMLVGDSALPQDHKGNTPGRDAQAELYVWFICQSSGLDDVRFEEPPDLRCSINQNDFGIAVKRVKNIDRLEERMKGGADQVHRTGLPGFIFADVTLASNPKNERIDRQVSDEQFGTLLLCAYQKWVGERVNDIRSWVQGKGVRGVVFIDHLIRLSERGVWGCESLRFGVHTTESETDQQEYDAFFGALQNGIIG